MAKRNGSGTIYKRGNIWWVQVYIEGRAVIESSKSTDLKQAKLHRDRMLGKKHRGEITGGAPDKVLIGELLDDVLESDIEPSTRYIWRKVIEKNIRPFFGPIRAARLTTALMQQYRRKRTIEDGRTESTANRELSILRTAFHNGRKRTPPKVNLVPYFPILAETTVRLGFLSDAEYGCLRDALDGPERLAFVCAYFTGMRKGELLRIEWAWVDFERNRIEIPSHVTKTGKPRSVPILTGDMLDLLVSAKLSRDEEWPSCIHVFHRAGKAVKDFRSTWLPACQQAGVPLLQFHDLRRTAVRNMRRAGVPQVVRMKISGHTTDSMERRYNIVDDDDLDIAKEFMERRAAL